MDKEYIDKNWFFFAYATALLIITTLGNIISKQNNVLYIIANYIVIFILLIFIKKIDYIKINDLNNKERKSKVLLFSGLIFLSWVPCFLAYYPVLFTYDVSTQFNQILNGEYSEYQPLIHTLLCKIFFSIGKNINNVNIGFALYSILQMLLLAYSMAYSLNYIYKKNVKNWIFYIVLFWYMFFPANPIMAISMTKDVIFSALFLLTFCYLLEYGEMERNIKNNILFSAKFIPISVIMMLFRNNAVYAYIIMIVFWVIKSLFKRKNKRYRGIIIASIIAIVLTYIILAVLKNTLNAKEGNKREMLSVPIQQISFVYLRHENEIDKYAKMQITKGIKIENIRACIPECSDIVKVGVNTDEILNNKMEFIKLYIKLGIKYPTDYIEAFLRLNMGYWYLGDTTYAHIYDKYFERQGYLLTDMKKIKGVDVYHDTKLPKLEMIYEKFATDNIQEKIPVISIVFAPSFYIMLFISSIVLKRKKQNILAHNLIVCYFITVILGPCALIRYAYPIMICTPIWIMYLMLEKKSTNLMEKEKG